MQWSKWEEVRLCSLLGHSVLEEEEAEEAIPYCHANQHSKVQWNREEIHVVLLDDVIARDDWASTRAGRTRELSILEFCLHQDRQPISTQE